MILEVADIRITPGREAEFEQAVHLGIQTVIAKATGFRGYRVQHGIESPDRYLLLLEWDTLEDHTVGFRGSSAYGEWRSIVSGFFAKAPFVEHFAASSSAPPGDAADAPIRGFSDCHVGIVQALDDLAALARDQGPVAGRSDRAGRILAFFRDVVVVHHAEEETELFPAVLADAGAGEERSAVEGLVIRLTSEHRHIEHLVEGLTPVLQAIEVGSDALMDPIAVGTLVDRYRTHAQVEENEFLPVARLILGRNSDHMAALGLALHIRHAAPDIRRRFGFI